MCDIINLDIIYKKYKIFICLIISKLYKLFKIDKIINIYYH